MRVVEIQGGAGPAEALCLAGRADPVVRHLVWAYAVPAAVPDSEPEVLPHAQPELAPTAGPAAGDPP